MVSPALRPLPLEDRDKGVEILALRQQITLVERQLCVGATVRFARLNCTDGVFPQAESPRYSTTGETLMPSSARPAHRA
ncbi:hypothetical protein E1267_21570 [Nonomuraea longispora]|uniref:Uncharacterized protein n=1 Tax=Nonomuraea longispora TaxID=1848320 RepID=A0A4V2XK23_9ACTN|nr:hypothetical protein E1267_21570 [Nonomuraea longispora]